MSGRRRRSRIGSVCADAAGEARKLSMGATEGRIGSVCAAAPREKPAVVHGRRREAALAASAPGAAVEARGVHGRRRGAALAASAPDAAWGVLGATEGRIGSVCAGAAGEPRVHGRRRATLAASPDARPQIVHGRHRGSRWQIYARCRGSTQVSAADTGSVRPT